MRRHILLLAVPLVGLLHASCTNSSRGFQHGDDAQFGSDAAVHDAAAETSGCSGSSTTIERVPVVMEFLIDESDSMHSVNKWRAARAALLATLADMRATADPATFLGVILYPKDDRVPPQSLVDDAHYEALVEAVDVNASGASTPTGHFLQIAYGIVERFEPPANAGLVLNETKRVVVLVSDGAPNDGRDRCERLVEENFAKGPPIGPIRTFSVGIGPFPKVSTEFDPAFMGKVAQKGGTAPDGCDPLSDDPSLLCHYQITPGEDVEATRQALVDAINEIRALSASCEFSFTTTPFTDLGNVTISVTDRNGITTPIPKDDANGWSFDDPRKPSKVILRGRSCSVTTGTPSGRINIVIGCRTPN